MMRKEKKHCDIKKRKSKKEKENTNEETKTKNPPFQRLETQHVTETLGISNGFDGRVGDGLEGVVDGDHVRGGEDGAYPYPCSMQ